MWRKRVNVCETPGLAVSVTEWSRGGLPCVFLHGFGDCGAVWNYLAVRMATQFRVAAVDWRGHGDSDWDPEARYESESFVGDLATIVEVFGFDRFILVGHSLGADVAIRYAAENASRVIALVIVDFGPELEKAGVDEVLRSFVATPRTFGSREEYGQWLVERRPLADPVVLQQMARASLRQSAAGLWELKADGALARHSEVNRFVANEGRYHAPGLWTALTRIERPSLVVRGGASAVLPLDVANRMASESLGDCRLAVIPAAGHSVMTDNPGAFSASVMGFLEDVRRGGAAVGR